MTHYTTLVQRCRTTNSLLADEIDAEFRRLEREIAAAKAEQREQDAKIAEAEYQKHNTMSGFDSQPARETAWAIREAIRRAGGE